MTMIYILCAAIILFFAATYLVYRIIFFASNKAKKITFAFPKGEQYEFYREPLELAVEKMKNRPFEEVFITAKDGTPLFGRYYHFKDGAPVHILIHGWRGFAVLDCSGGTALAEKIGHNAIVIDQRANGRSGGHCISFGVREKEDCACWIQYVTDRFGKDTTIILSGISMGAATVLMASGMELPSNVKCILADCPFSSAEDIIKEVCSVIKAPQNLIYGIAKLGARIFGHFDLAESNALKAVAKAKLPILILHGEDDRFVPCHMGKTLHATNPEWVTLATFPDAGHGLSYMTAPEEYEKAVISFLEKHLA